MSDRSFQELTTAWESQLAKTQRVVAGIAQNGATCGQRVNVRLDQAIPGQPNPVPAIAWTTCHSGKIATLFRFDGEDQWRAMGEGTTRATTIHTVRRVHRRAKPPVAVSGGLVKVLFSVNRNDDQKGEYFGDLYVGGDRPQPIKIFTWDRNVISVRSAYITNTGKKADDWIVSLILYEYSYESHSESYKILTLQPSGSIEQGFIYGSLAYFGNGFFSSGDLLSHAYQELAKRIEFNANGSSAGQNYHHYSLYRYLNGVLVEHIEEHDGSGYIPYNFLQTAEITYGNYEPSLSAFGLYGSGYDKQQRGGYIFNNSEYDIERHVTSATDRLLSGNARSFSYDPQNGMQTFEGYWFDKKTASGQDDQPYSDIRYQIPDTGFDIHESEEKMEGVVPISPTLSKPFLTRDYSKSNFVDSGNDTEQVNDGILIDQRFTPKLAGKTSAISKRYSYSRIDHHKYVNGRTVESSDNTQSDEYLAFHQGDREVRILGDIPDLTRTEWWLVNQYLQEVNLVGNQVIAMPINYVWRQMATAQKFDATVYAIAEDGSVTSSKKPLNVYPLLQSQAAILAVSAIS